MKVLFRSDSSTDIGTGHIMRDLVLAKRLEKKNRIYFATRNLEGNIDFKIKKAGFDVVWLPNDSVRELDRVIKRLRIDMLIIDSYKLGYRFEKKIKSLNPKLKIFVIDDRYQKHFCDILLNHNIHADAKRYRNLVPKTSKVFCGSRYTLLREEFYQEKNRRYRDAKRVLVALGGTDGENLTLRILKILERYGLERVVLTTTANKNLDTLKRYARENDVELHINSDKVARLIQSSSLVVTTPSVMLNEVYFLQKDFIAIKSAENQKEMIAFLRRNSFDILERFDEEEFVSLLQRRYGRFDTKENAMFGESE